MKNEKLLDALGKIDEEFIAEAAPENKPAKKKLHRMTWVKRGIVAASVCLLIAGVVNTLDRLDYGFAVGCSAYPGKIVDGTYYYYIPHEGVMRYTPEGESERILHTYCFEEWDVNEYGIYYKQGMSVYVRDHETGTRTKLYTSDSFENTHIGFTLAEDNNVIVTNYNKNMEIVYEVLVDGVKGGVLETVMGKTSYDVAKTVYYSGMHYFVGDREITFEPIDSMRDKFFVIENENNILPETFYTSRYIEGYFGDVLFLEIWNDDFQYNGITKKLFMIYPDGTNKAITVPEERYEGGTAEYLFYVSDNAVGCVDTSTGEAWHLEADAEIDIYDLEANGEYVYTCAPWAEETACWKLIYNEDGKPISMTLVDDDIITEE